MCRIETLYFDIAYAVEVHDWIIENSGGLSLHAVGRNTPLAFCLINLSPFRTKNLIRARSSQDKEAQG